MYLGPIDSMRLNSDHAAALFDGIVQLHKVGCVVFVAVVIDQ